MAMFCDNLARELGDIAEAGEALNFVPPKKTS
jgi:hypothetical protein